MRQGPSVALEPGPAASPKTMLEAVCNRLIGFAELHPSLKRQVLSSFKLVHFQKEVLVRPGDNLSKAYVVVSGSFSATSPIDIGENLVLRHVGPGDIMCENALYEDSPRMNLLIRRDVSPASENRPTTQDRRPADRMKSGARIFEISGRTYRSLLARADTMGENLGMIAFLSTSPLFQACDVEVIADRFESQFFQTSAELAIWLTMSVPSLRDGRKGAGVAASSPSKAKEGELLCMVRSGRLVVTLNSRRGGSVATTDTTMTSSVIGKIARGQSPQKDPSAGFVSSLTAEDSHSGRSVDQTVFQDAPALLSEELQLEFGPGECFGLHQLLTWATDPSSSLVVPSVGLMIIKHPAESAHALPLAFVNAVARTSAQKILCGTPAFRAEFTPEELIRLANSAVHRSYPQNTSIFTRGLVCERVLHVITSGISHMLATRSQDRAIQRQSGADPVILRQSVLDIVKNKRRGSFSGASEILMRATTSSVLGIQTFDEMAETARSEIVGKERVRKQNMDEDPLVPSESLPRFRAPSEGTIQRARASSWQDFDYQPWDGSDLVRENSVQHSRNGSPAVLVTPPRDAHAIRPTALVTIPAVGHALRIPPPLGSRGFFKTGLLKLGGSPVSKRSERYLGTPSIPAPSMSQDTDSPNETELSFVRNARRMSEVDSRSHDVPGKDAHDARTPVATASPSYPPRQTPPSSPSKLDSPQLTRSRLRSRPKKKDQKALHVADQVDPFEHSFAGGGAHNEASTGLVVCELSAGGCCGLDAFDHKVLLAPTSAPYPWGDDAETNEFRPGHYIPSYTVQAATDVQCLCFDVSSCDVLLERAVIVCSREAACLEARIANRRPLRFQDLTARRVLGEGATGLVRMVVHSLGGVKHMSMHGATPFAMKIMPRKLFARPNGVKQLQRERELLMTLNHPFLLRCTEAFQSPTRFYLLLDLELGGELMDLIEATGGLTIDAARFFFACVMAALKYLHCVGVAHRDLKPENLLLDSKGYLKLIDLGFARRIGSLSEAHGESQQSFASSGRCFSFCGTPEYMAPEIITGVGHSTPVDIWSLGVLLFEMLAGETPFSSASLSENATAVVTTVYQGVLALFGASEWRYRHHTDNVDILRRILNFAELGEDAEAPLPNPRARATPNEMTSANDILREVFRVEPSRRATASECLNHPFLRGIDLHALERRALPAPVIPNFSSAGLREKRISLSESFGSDGEFGNDDTDDDDVDEDEESSSQYDEDIETRLGREKNRNLAAKLQQEAFATLPGFVLVTAEMEESIK